MKKILKWVLRVLLGLVGLVVILFVGIWIASDPYPQGEQGPEADALAQKVWEATNKSAWDSVGAVCWNFGGRHKLLWDKKRHLARVQWNKNEVYVDINQKSGVAFQDGERVKDKKNDDLVISAWQWWVNDSFWLNAPAKIFDPGTSRSLVKMEDDSEALLVQYSSGGATPGDAYLWILDKNGRPKAWRLWVKIVPIKGFEFSWENWKKLSNGAEIAQTHASKLYTLEITDIQTAPSAAELNGGQDPFAILFE